MTTKLLGKFWIQSWYFMFLGARNSKMLVFFYFDFPHFLEKSKIWRFLQKFIFRYKFLNVFFQNTVIMGVLKNCDRCHRKCSKKLLNLVRVLRGKLTLAPPPPHMLTGTFFSADSGFWVLWDKIYTFMTMSSCPCWVPPPPPPSTQRLL